MFPPLDAVRAGQILIDFAAGYHQARFAVQRARIWRDWVNQYIRDVPASLVARIIVQNAEADYLERELRPAAEAYNAGIRDAVERGLITIDDRGRAVGLSGLPALIAFFVTVGVATLVWFSMKAADQRTIMEKSGALSAANTVNEGSALNHRAIVELNLRRIADGLPPLPLPDVQIVVPGVPGGPIDNALARAIETGTNVGVGMFVLVGALLVLPLIAQSIQKSTRRHRSTTNGSP